MLTSRINEADNENNAKPYCQCENNNARQIRENSDTCSCGENDDPSEWKWDAPKEPPLSSWVVFSSDQKQVTFHPFYSSGTGAVRGDTPLQHNYHYYWEVKMLTNPYGTDVMIGVGSDKFNISNSLTAFVSLLGRDGESYGLSYKGTVRHNSLVSRECAGFCGGTIVGIMLDMWQGTLQFYLNRKSEGISFFNLRRHKFLYPMICSTAAYSSMRLIYTASWQASLLVDAAKMLAASVSTGNRTRLPPGLKQKLKSQFWLTISKDFLLQEENNIKNKAISTQTDSIFSLPNSVQTNSIYIEGPDGEYCIEVEQ